MKNPSTLKLVLNRLKPMWYLVVISLFLAITIVAFTLLLPILVGQAIDVVVDKNNVDFAKLTMYFLYMVVSITITSIAQWLMSIVNNKIIYKISNQIMI